MRILVVLWTVCLVGLCHCGNEIDGRNTGGGQTSLRNTQGQSQPENIPLQNVPSKPATGVTLNIKKDKADKNTIERYNPKLHSIETPIYTAKNGYYIEKVVDEATVLCYPPKGAFIKVTHCYRDKWFDILHVYIIESDGKKNVKYFLKKDDKWSPIKEEEFYDHFNALSHTEHAFKEKEFRLDKKQTDWKIYINESPKSPFKVYAARSNRRVKEIKDSNTSVWKRRKDEWCTKISIYPREGDYKLMWIVTKDPYEHEEILYYSKNGTTWKEVNRDAYLEDLKKAGFNESTFNDRVTLNIARPDKDLFFEDKYNVDIVTMNRYHVLPGFRISKVVDGMNVIWESKEDKFATYFRLNTRGSKVSLGALFTTNIRKEHKIIYYAKLDDKWKVIDKSLYYDILAGRGSPVYTREAPKPTIVMSSFRNKKDLKVVSYAFTIDSAKADIILIHGIRGSVITDYGTFNMDWSYEHYGFDVFPHISIFDDSVKDVKKVSNVDRYRQYFEYKTLEGMNPYDVLHRSRYEGCFLEALNRMGYNVYSYDLQSHGLSEAKTNKRCHVENYEDYVHDVLQFVSIIKRGKFSDASQTYDEQTVLKSVDCSRKIFLIGYSMGGNMVIRAVEKFYKTVEAGAHFVDAMIGLSPMLNLDQYIGTWYMKWLVAPTLELDAWCQPEKQAYFDYPYDIGVEFDRFADYHTDMLYYNRIYTRNTSMASFTACRRVRKNERTKRIPKTLPIFFVHTTDDDTCLVKGTREFVGEHLYESTVVKFLELSGNGHYILATQLVPIIIPQLSSWLDQTFYGGAKYLPPKPLKVSLADRVDSSIFNVQEGMEKGVPVLKLKVKPGKSATKLVYMGKTIWSGGCSSCSSCVSAGCASSLSSATFYFNGTVLELVKVTVGETEKLLYRTKTTCCRRTSIEWVENKTKFNARLKWLEGASKVDTSLPKLEEMVKDLADVEETPSLPEPFSQPTIPLKDAKLDIRSLDRSLFNLEYSFDGKVVVNSISPKRGTIHITEVTEKGVLLWKSSSDERVKSIVVRDDGDSPPTATIKYIKNGKESTVCSYRDGNGHWNIPVSLDITSPDSSKVDIHEGVDSGISYKNCSPRGGQSIVTIVDNGETVWKAEGGERCTFVEYYARGGVTLLGLGISDGHSTKPKCFEKNGQEWTEISDDVFFNKHGLMVEEPGSLPNPTTGKEHTDNTIDSDVDTPG